MPQGLLPLAGEQMTPRDLFQGGTLPMTSSPWPLGHTCLGVRLNLREPAVAGKPT